MEARRAEIAITYQGVSWERNIQKYLTSFQYKDCASGESDQIEIQLSDKDGIWIRDWFPQKGDTIEASMTLLNWKGENQKECFDVAVLAENAGKTRVSKIRAVFAKGEKISLL